MTEQQRFNFNIFFLIYVIMWKMIQTFYLGGFDGAGRITVLMMTIAFFVNYKSFFHTSREVYVWGAWIVYVIVCSKIKGFYSETNSFSNWFPGALVLPFMSMQIAVQAVNYNWRKTLQVLFYVYVTFVILGILNMGGHSRDTARVSNDLGNYYFNNTILLAVYASIVFSLGEIKKIVYYTLLAIVLYAIFISGERKGLICVFIIVLGSLYAMNYGKGMKSFFSTIGLALIAYVAVELIMNYSVAGARMAEGMTASAFQDNLFLKLMGDRGIMYYEGWEMFLDNIWTGIGIRNFCWNNSFFYGLPLHTEYMVQLTECGICGTGLFVLFNYGVIRKLFGWFKSSTSRTVPIILISTMASILAINFVSWTYSYSGYFIVFGLVLGLSQSVKFNQ